MKGKALRKHSLPLTPPSMSRNPFSNANKIHVHTMIPEDQKNINMVFIEALKTINQTP